ncbi:MAG: transcription-repair coupling factor [Clostridia bacterium]|nr:transcription-repair coupling factor [Clostridia bacterium]
MSFFSQSLKKTSEYPALVNYIKKGRVPMGALGLSQIHKAHIISSLLGDFSPRQAVVIVPDESQATRLCKDLKAFGCNALLYPAGDISLRTNQIKSREYEHRRLSVLGKLLDGNADAVVLSVEAALQLTIPPEVLFQKRISLKVGEDVVISELVQKLLSSGYSSTENVEGSGQFAVRGGIVDVFSPDSDMPFRIDFWGDTIDSISFFETDTQRRVSQIEEITITPANEICCDNKRLIELIGNFADKVKGKGSVKVKESLRKDIDSLEAGISLSSLDRYLPLIYEDSATIFDYVERPLLFVSESFSIKDKANAVLQLFNEEYSAYLSEGVVCKGLDRYVLSFEELLGFYTDLGAIYLDNLARGSFDIPVKELITFNARQISPWNGSLSVLKDDLQPFVGKKNKKTTIVIASGTPKASQALADDLNKDGYQCSYIENPAEDLPSGSITVMPGGFSTGFEYPTAGFMLITYGAREALPVKKKTKKVNKAAVFNSLEELHKGDYIVHVSHGIGIFDGITQLEADGNIKDYIKIKYDKGDVLYVPVTQLDQVSKYIGPNSESGMLKLNRLGGSEWNKTRSKVRSSVKDMAKELIELYSKRMKMEGHAFSPDIDMQNDFERRFEFDETDDQLRCIYEIKSDMEKPHPMDRLLCGDVGFGKTEVAIRAAFKCVADGKQCAILVPTTILALQHFQTIRKRIEGFPVEAQMLSRFVSPKEQEKIKEDLKKGYVDIIVGTHRLISKDVKFRDLGLIIVDEEQRFGVAQKEKLKSAYPNVDVLTLSATPIPRTLNMAMSGIRDMSILEEAPQDRHPVQTYVIEHDPEVLALAMANELRRGGQVYYLHNRTETIARTAAKIKEMLPDARVEYAHGQMTEEKLSSIWQRLMEGETDILVCTTIIETGVDVPNANTLIVENADRMGLSQLHQLRGRVGRSTRRASAYFTFTKGKELTEIAAKRLTAIREYTEFGSGFRIAMRDLEIRGAGNLLGTQQHGHMEAVGYDLYMKMLNQAVGEEKGELQPAPEKECLIDLPVDAYIPSEYIPNVPHKIAMYRRIADIRNEEDADDVIDELIDRFGEMPSSVLGLITISLLRNTAISQGIYEINRSGDTIKLFIESLDMSKITALAQNMKGRITVSAAGKPHIAIRIHLGEDQLTILKKSLEIMEKTGRAAK